MNVELIYIAQTIDTYHEETFRYVATMAIINIMVRRMVIYHINVENLI